MRDQLSEALRGQPADYIEIRLEEFRTTRLQYRDREIEEIGGSLFFGGNVRALVRGSWGFVSFNQPDDLREKVTLAVRQARLSGREESQLAPVEPVVDITQDLENDPSKVPLARKKELLDEYNELIWSTPKIQT
ncbi:MAG: TldD/PmbA family protein, partial [Chloroflexi bacterium]